MEGFIEINFKKRNNNVDCSCRKQFWRSGQSKIRVQQIHCCFMTVTSMRQQNRICSHPQMFPLEKITASAFPSLCEAWLARGWDSARSWQPVAALAASRGRGSAEGTLCLMHGCHCRQLSTSSWRAALHKPGLQLTQLLGREHVHGPSSLYT